MSKVRSTSKFAFHRICWSHAFKQKAGVRFFASENILGSRQNLWRVNNLQSTCYSHQVQRERFSGFPRNSFHFWNEK